MAKSRQQRKQRKHFYQRPLHERRADLNARLSKELSLQTKRRNFPVVKGDKVKVVRGENAGKEGKVTQVSLKKRRIAVEGIVYKTRQGKEKPFWLAPSKVKILELNLVDEQRKKALARTGTTSLNTQAASPTGSTVSTGVTGVKTK